MALAKHSVTLLATSPTGSEARRNRMSLSLNGSMSSLRSSNRANPLQQQQTTVEVTVFEALQHPSSGINTSFVSNDRAGHARDHGVRVPIHVLGPGIRLSAPGARSFLGDGFHEVIALVNRVVRTERWPAR